MNRTARMQVVGLLAVSLVCLALAPALMPPGYSIVDHSVSESAAQGVAGGWLARLGLVLLGVAVLTLAAKAPPTWTRWARTAHAGFGVSAVATAVFSHAPWDGSASDQMEDLLHSVASFGVGLFFTLGVALVALARSSPSTVRRLVDWSAVSAAVAIPLAMPVVGAPGLLQRLMFLIAFAWYGVEAMSSGPGAKPASTGPSNRPGVGHPKDGAGKGTTAEVQHHQD